MLKTILSISGKPGLYKLVSRGNRSLIVETLDEVKKRMPAFATDKVISLADIAMYTDEGEVPLREVLNSLKKKEKAQLSAFDYKRLHVRNWLLILQRYCLIMIVTAFILPISRSW